MAVEAGAGRDEAYRAGTRMHKMENRLVFKMVLTAKKSVRTLNYADVQGASEELVRSYLS